MNWLSVECKGFLQLLANIVHVTELPVKRMHNHGASLLWIHKDGLAQRHTHLSSSATFPSTIGFIALHSSGQIDKKSKHIHVHVWTSTLTVLTTAILYFWKTIVRSSMLSWSKKNVNNLAVLHAIVKVQILIDCVWNCVFYTCILKFGVIDAWESS